MNVRSLYMIATGELTGLQMTASDAVLALNTPAGAAWVDGAHDARRSTVQLVTDDHGEQVPVATARTPQRPADSAYQTWAWAAEAGDWVSSPTLLLLQTSARPQILVQLDALDDMARRPIGEISLAQALSQAPSTLAVQRLQAIESDKSVLRAYLAAIAAAADTAALQALLNAPPELQAFNA